MPIHVDFKAGYHCENLPYIVPAIGACCHRSLLALNSILTKTIKAEININIIWNT